MVYDNTDEIEFSRRIEDHYKTTYEATVKSVVQCRNEISEPYEQILRGTVERSPPDIWTQYDDVSYQGPALAKLPRSGRT